MASMVLENRADCLIFMKIMPLMTNLNKCTEDVSCTRGRKTGLLSSTFSRYCKKIKRGFVMEAFAATPKLIINPY